MCHAVELSVRDLREWIHLLPEVEIKVQVGKCQEFHDASPYIQACDMRALSAPARCLSSLKSIWFFRRAHAAGDNVCPAALSKSRITTWFTSIAASSDVSSQSRSKPGASDNAMRSPNTFRKSRATTSALGAVSRSVREMPCTSALTSPQPSSPQS
jgi:hypothetical protein